MLMSFVLAVLAQAVFLHSFFPIDQYKSSTLIKPPQSLNDISFDSSELYPKSSARLVVVVIDSLRFDFVSKTYMPLLEAAWGRNGCLFEIETQSPTVTLPRIKTLTAGQVPQFSDMIFNLFNSEAILSDSLLHRATEQGKLLVFYGDDTWLKLYPGLFHRYEGVSSFFVTDFYEVDRNVTRNLDKELRRSDWDAMFLHYLGLDHIGHVHGSRSKLVAPKLAEMDQVIRKLAALTNTLVVVTGDHGMKEGGGHGGSSTFETHVPLAIVGISCHNGFARQSDIVPTLSVLLGLPIPANSIGSVIPNVILNLSLKQQLYLLRYSSLHLQSKLDLYVNLVDQAGKLHYEYLKNGSKNSGIEAMKFYKQFLDKTSNTLLHSLIGHDVYKLLLVIVLQLICIGNTCKTIQVAFVFLALILPLACFVLFCTRKDFIQALRANWYLVPYLTSLSSSSLIEEEHQFWYYFSTTLLILMAHSHKTVHYVIMAGGLRLLCKLNQTGDKWSHLPDLSDWLTREDNRLVLDAVAMLSLLFIVIQLSDHRNFLLDCIVLVVVYVFKTGEIRIFIAAYFICGTFFCKNFIKHSIFSWIALNTFLFRPHNIILLPVCVYFSDVVCASLDRPDLICIAHIVFAKTLFFCQGHSNSLSSVDVSSGYIGISEYSMLVVFGQALCHTYAIPVLCSLLALRVLDVSAVYREKLSFQQSTLTFCSISTICFRHHLFVWTVFAPKLLIESINSLVLLIEAAIAILILKTNRK